MGILLFLSFFNDSGTPPAEGVQPKLKFSLYTKDSDDHYVIHTECMKITDGHHVLISIE